MSFKVSLDISQESLSRAALDQAVKTLVVYDFVGGKLVKEIKQASTDSGFGTIDLNLEFGKHKLMFVGHNSESCTFDTDNTFLTFDKVLDTFSHCVELTVDEETTDTQSTTLERQVAGIELAPTDKVASNASSIEITIQGYSSKLNPETGAGSDGEKFVKSWTYRADQLGKPDIKYLIYSFLPTTSHHVDFSVRILDANGNVLSNHSIDDVTIEKNKKTVITGNIFSTQSEATVTANTTWGTNITVNI